MICEVDEPESAFPGVERCHGKTFLGAELGDRQTAVNLALNALAPECMEYEVGSSGHGMGSCEGTG
jgi:hypothetical protein